MDFKDANPRKILHLDAHGNRMWGRDVEAAHTRVTDFHSVSVSNFFSIWEKMLQV